jgi:hypothetical protein
MVFDGLSLHDKTPLADLLTCRRDRQVAAAGRVISIWFGLRTNGLTQAFLREGRVKNAV